MRVEVSFSTNFTMHKIVCRWSEIAMNNWCFTRKRKNSFYLYGDGDDVAIIEEIERRFAVQITDEEAKAILTFGDLLDTVISKISMDKGADDNKLWEDIEGIIKRQLSGRYGENIKVNRKTSFFSRDAVE